MLEENRRKLPSKFGITIVNDLYLPFSFVVSRCNFSFYFAFPPAREKLEHVFIFN